MLVRTDNAGCTHAVLNWMTTQRLSYSVGFTLPDHAPQLLAKIPQDVWAPAIDAHDEIRDGAWVAEVTDLLDLTGWPPGMRVIVRKEKPHPGAQLRFDDVDGMRITAFATNTGAGGRGTQLPDLELRHRRRARAEDRIRLAKDTGLRNLPLFTLDQNRIWCAVVALALEVTAWMQTLALHGTDARRWEPKRLRLRLFSVPATLARTGRRVLLHLSATAPWAATALTAINRLQALPVPGQREPPRPDDPLATPGSGPGAPETTSDEMSHPTGRITLRRRPRPPPHPSPVVHARSGVVPTRSAA